MAVPKHKVSKSVKKMRRSHHALKAQGVSVCQNCKNVKLPHRICTHCGFYKGQEIIATVEE